MCRVPGIDGKIGNRKMIESGNTRTIHGNYKDYYSYRGDAFDRKKILQKNWFEGKNVLDVGCNSGIMTTVIAQHFLPNSIVGIDIDSSLINNAHIILSKSQAKSIFVPRAMAIGTRRYPNNIKFRCQDILTLNNMHNKYETIYCSNLVKWVHLNNGDMGLLMLFTNLFNLLVPSGLLILEYQPWKSYRNNRNSSKVSKENFKSIKINPSQFECILVSQCGFTVQERLGPSLEDAFGYSRPILVLRKGSSDVPLVLASLEASVFDVIKANEVSGTVITRTHRRGDPVEGQEEEEQKDQTLTVPPRKRKAKDALLGGKGSNGVGDDEAGV